MTMKTITQEQISRFLREEICVPANLKGFVALKLALLKACNDDCTAGWLNLYADVAALLPGETAQKVERAIRHAITVTYPTIPREFRKKLFGTDSDYKVENSRFISSIADYLKERSNPEVHSDTLYAAYSQLTVGYKIVYRETYEITPDLAQGFMHLRSALQLLEELGMSAGKKGESES